MSITLTFEKFIKNEFEPTREKGDKLYLKMMKLNGIFNLFLSGTK